MIKTILYYARMFFCVFVIQPIFFLFPRSSKIMIFGAWWGNRFDDNPAHLFKYITKNRKDIKAYWFTNNTDVFEKVKHLGYPVVYSNSIKAMFISIHAKYEIYCTSQDDIGELCRSFMSGCVTINLWHGAVFKKIGLDNEYARLKKTSKKEKIVRVIHNIVNGFSKIFYKKYYIVSTSEAMSKILKHAIACDDWQMLNLGQARNDCLFFKGRNEISDRYKNMKIILYAPTHRNEGKKRMDLHELLDLKSINDFCKKNNAVLLIKKHYYHYNDPVICENEFSNIKELTYENPETQELLRATDILISDYSSIYIDFLLLNRPVLFYSYDLEEYMSVDRQFYLDYNQNNFPGKFCKNTQELLAELTRLFGGDDRFVSLRNKMKNYYFSPENQGTVAEKQVQKILTL